jgi:HSP20 family molecular chaperone IbpA
MKMNKSLVLIALCLICLHFVPVQGIYTNWGYVLGSLRNSGMEISQVNQDVDVVSTKDHYLVICNLPGVDNPEIELEGSTLKISGKPQTVVNEVLSKLQLEHSEIETQIPEEPLEENAKETADQNSSAPYKYLHRSRAESFVVQVKIPSAVDEDNIIADLHNGVLVVVLPKQAPKQVKVTLV